MPVPERSKPKLLVLLLGWPVAGLLGLAVGRVTQTNWPAGVLPAGWFVVLVLALRQYAGRPDDGP